MMMVQFLEWSGRKAFVRSGKWVLDCHNPRFSREFISRMCIVGKVVNTSLFCRQRFLSLVTMNKETFIDSYRPLRDSEVETCRSLFGGCVT